MSEFAWDALTMATPALLVWLATYFVMWNRAWHWRMLYEQQGRAIDYLRSQACRIGVGRWSFDQATGESKFELFRPECQLGSCSTSNREWQTTAAPSKPSRKRDK